MWGGVFVDDAELARRLRVLADEAAYRRGTGGPLGRLELLRRLRTVLDTAEGQAMAEARAAEHDWAQLGAALGLTGQGAGFRYRRHHQLTDPRPGGNRPRRRPRSR